MRPVKHRVQVRVRVRIRVRVQFLAGIQPHHGRHRLESSQDRIWILNRGVHNRSLHLHLLRLDLKRHRHRHHHRDRRRSSSRIDPTLAIQRHHTRHTRPAEQALQAHMPRMPVHRIWAHISVRFRALLLNTHIPSSIRPLHDLNPELAQRPLITPRLKHPHLAPPPRRSPPSPSFSS